MKLTSLIVFVVFLLVLGTYCLFSPRKIQILALRMAESGFTFRSGWITDFLRSSAYVLSLRLVGLITYIMAAILIASLLKDS